MTSCGRLHPPFLRRQALLWGLAALLGGLSAAQAAPGFRPGAAVLSFQNVSIYSGHLMGRRAADQLALSLGATGVWRVVDRAQADRACLQRDLRPPYAVAYQQEIAHALGADVIFSGTIQKLEVDPKLGTIKLTIFVEAIHQVAGQSLLAQVQTGEAQANAAAPEPTDVLIGQALGQALDKVALVAAQNTGILTTVSDPADSKLITLKAPEGAQMASGYRLLLYRSVTENDTTAPGKLIGVVLITEAGPETCRAKVMARSAEIHTGDFAVSVCCTPKTE